MDFIKKINLEKLILFIGVIYLFFLFRRGDSKYLLAIILICLSFIQGAKENFQRIIRYKKEVMISLIYIFLILISHFISEYKENRLDEALRMSIYSIGFLFVGLNLKISEKYYKYILPSLMIFSLSSIGKGFQDFYKNFNRLSWYRVGGGEITTEYAFEIGIYLLIGIVGYLYYKRKIYKFFSGGYIVLNIILMVATKSRNLVVVMPVLVAIIFILVYKRNLKWFFISLFSTMILLLGALKFSSKISLLNRLSAISSLDKIKDDIRTRIYFKGIEFGKENILMGNGLYKYKVEGFKVINDSRSFGHFHNNFIEVFATQGIIVLVGYIIFLIILGMRLLKDYTLEEKFLEKSIKLLAFLVFLFMILYGQFEVSYYFKKGYQIVFTIISLSLMIDIKK